MKRNISFVGVFLGFIFMSISAVYACPQSTKEPYGCDQLTICYPNTTVGIENISCVQGPNNHIFLDKKSFPPAIVLQQDTGNGTTDQDINCTILFTNQAEVQVVQGNCRTSGKSQEPVLKNLNAASVNYSVVSNDKNTSMGGAIDITDISKATSP